MSETKNYIPTESAKSGSPPSVTLHKANLTTSYTIIWTIWLPTPQSLTQLKFTTKMIPARNVTAAHMQDFVANELDCLSW